MGKSQEFCDYMVHMRFHDNFTEHAPRVFFTKSKNFLKMQILCDAPNKTTKITL